MSVKVLVCYSDECESMCYVILMSVKVLVTGYVILMNVKVLVCYSDACVSMCYVILMNVKVLVCYSDERESIGMLC